MTLHRRSFLAGLASSLAAPALVRAASLMPVRGIVMPIDVADGGFLVPPEFRVFIGRCIELECVFIGETQIFPLDGAR